MTTKFFIPNLLEYIYDSIVKRGFPFLFERLSRQDFLKVRNHSKTRVFVETANIEDKMLMLGKLGFGCALVLWDKEKQFNKKVHDVLIAYLHTPEHELAAQVVREKIFATVDLDIIRSLQTLSKVCNSGTYAVNRKYYEIRKSAETLSTTRKLSQKLVAEKNLEWYSRTIQAALDIAPVLETFKLKMPQFRMLVFLHTLPNGATEPAIVRHLNRGKITHLLKELDGLNMIKLAGDIISIDVYGIMVLEQIFEKFP